MIWNKIRDSNMYFTKENVMTMQPSTHATGFFFSLFFFAFRVCVHVSVQERALEWREEFEKNNRQSPCMFKRRQVITELLI